MGSTYRRYEGPIPWPTTSPKRAANRLGVRVEMILRMCRKGEIEAIKTATDDGRMRKWLIRESVIDDLVRRRLEFEAAATDGDRESSRAGSRRA